MSDEAPDAMPGFTALEGRAIDAIREMSPEIAAPLGRLLTTARLTERDNTGVGFFSSFTVDRTLPAISWHQRFVDGPNAEVQVGDDVLLMGFILWLEDGYPDCLEGFQYATTDGREIDLKATGLDGLRWLRNSATGSW